MPENGNSMKSTTHLDLNMMTQKTLEERKGPSKNSWPWQLGLDLVASDLAVVYLIFGLWSFLSR